MNRDETDCLWALVRRLQRAPEAVDDPQAQRALTVLTASRSDATYLLLQRVLVLELALDHIRQQRVADSGSPGAGPGRPDAPPAWRPSPFLRDAAVIAAGVVGGGAVLAALDGLGITGETFGDAADDSLGDAAGLF